MKKGILLCLITVLSIVSSADLVIGSGSSVYVGNARVYLYGGLRNPLTKDGEKEKMGDIDFHASSRLHFVGSGNHVIENIYALSNITVDKPSGHLSIENNTNHFLLAGNAALGNGNLMTGSSVFELGPTATVTGESTNGYIVGRVRSARSIGTSSSAGTGHFGGIGFTINNTGSNLGTVTVNRHTGAGTQETIFGSQGIQRKWEVETSVSFSGTRSVTASWLSTNDNGNNMSNVKVWKQATSKDGSGTETGDMRRSMSLTRPAGITSANARFDELIDFGPDEERSDESNIYQEPKTVGWMEVTGASFSTAGDPRTATFNINESTLYTINDIGNQFAGGAGTEGNPYQIETLDHLNNVRNYLSAHFIQIADIDASPTSTWNGGAGWVPIGTSFSDNFTGVYNGNGHTISGLFINRPSTNYQGLFGRTQDATIKDIGLIGSDITGQRWVGNIVGLSSNSLIENSFTDGNITGHQDVGGFVGRNATSSIINNCYANGSLTRVAGQSFTTFGGFSGENYNEITNSYSTVSVHYEGVADPTNRGFTGSNSGTMTGNFWNTETSGQTSTAGTATGLTTIQMMSWENFLNDGWDFQGETANGTEDIWGINPLANIGFPFLSWQAFTHNPYSGFAGGFGTEEHPYQVETLDHLDNVRNHLSSYFIQIANIDASPTSTWNSGAGFDPIGRLSPYFSGKYNGNGHTVSGLFINRSGTTSVGLFGRTTSSSEIYDLGLLNVDITGGSYTGSLIGYPFGTTRRCYTTGQVKTNGTRSGGFVGYAGTGNFIENSYANVQVTRTGGSNEEIGAFCGRHYSSTIINSYSTGSVHYEGFSDPTDKGFVGAIGSGTTMTGNFWNTETSGQTSTAGTATGLTSEQMRDMNVFTAVGWDFQGETANGTDDVWGLNFFEHDGFPFLSWQGYDHNPFAGFAGGIGTENNPFQVETLDQLDNVRNHLSAHFIQIADIDASPTSTWNSGAGWVPIGTQSTPFTGKYNGSSHIISGIHILRPNTDNVGLFGRADNATIRNLGVSGSNITGRQYVGNISGRTVSALMENCFSNGIIEGTADVGGLVGRVSTASIIRNCYANGSVTRASGQSSTYIAGFTGGNWGAISNSYSTASVQYEGVDDPTNRGFTGNNSGTMTGNFWNTETSGQTSTVGTATGLTTIQMMSWENFLNDGWDFQGETANGSEDIWGINPLANNGFPFLSWQGFTHNPYSGFAGGFGTEEHPYQVETLDHLDNVRNYLSSHFIQISDIDASPTSTWNSGAGWVPVRTSSPYFTGSYDGDHHKITDLHINRSANYQSLFGYTSGAMISNLHLIDVDITGAGYVSGLVGSMDNSSVIDRCSVKGHITGSSDYVAPIAAYVINNSIVSRSFANAQTRGLGYVAGLVGRVGVGSEAIDSYAMGSASRISGNSVFMGGIAGYNNASNIIRCYSTVSIHHEDAADPTNNGITYGAQGGFVMEDNFWDIETSGQTSSGGNATGKTTAEMKQEITFTNWDFVTGPVWKIKETVTYPYLAWQPESTEITFALNPPAAGTINASSGHFPEGMPITLSATPNSEYNFLNWTSADLKTVLSTDPVFEYVVTGQDVAITANFKAILLATVTTSDASAVLFTSANLGGNVTGDGGGEVSERGIVYSDSEDPEIDGPGVTKVQIGSGTGSFSQTVSDLEQGSMYHFRAYAINEAGVNYGENKFFVTSELSAPSNLSLSVVGTDVEIVWDEVTGATGYYVYSSEDPYGSFALNETGFFTGEKWTGPLTAEKMFYFVIAVYDSKVIPQRTIQLRNSNIRSE